MKTAGYTYSETSVLQAVQITALQLSVVDTLDKLVPVADNIIKPPIQGIPKRSHRSVGCVQLAPPGVDMNLNLPVVPLSRAGVIAICVSRAA